MKKKVVQVLIAISVLLSSVLVPGTTVYANHVVCTAAAPCTCTTGQNCFRKDPQHTYNGGISCASGATTLVYGNPGKTSSNLTFGQVNVSLRYSDRCKAKWTKGIVYVTTASTKQFAVRTDAGGYYTTWFVRNSLVFQGAVIYNDMVNGLVSATALAGLRGPICDGNIVNGHATGFSSTCTYTSPVESYSN